MPDREKFLYAAICFGNDARHDCRECDYYIRTNCVEYCDERRIVRDALALLKEQEAELQKGRYYSDVFDIGYKAGKESIVLCKDCVYYIAGNGCGDINGESPARNLIDVRPDWFCADGVRRE